MKSNVNKKLVGNLLVFKKIHKNTLVNHQYRSTVKRQDIIKVHQLVVKEKHQTKWKSWARSLRAWGPLQLQKQRYMVIINFRWKDSNICPLSPILRSGVCSDCFSSVHSLLFFHCVLHTVASRMKDAMKRGSAGHGRKSWCTQLLPNTHPEPGNQDKTLVWVYASPLLHLCTFYYFASLLRHHLSSNLKWQ